MIEVSASRVKASDDLAREIERQLKEMMEAQGVSTETLAARMKRPVAIVKTMLNNADISPVRLIAIAYHALGATPALLSTHPNTLRPPATALKTRKAPTL